MDRLSVSQPRGFRTRGHCAPPPTRSPTPAEARPRPALHSRSLNLGLALPGVAAVPERLVSVNRPPWFNGTDTAFGSTGAGARNLDGPPGSARCGADPEDEQGQPALGAPRIHGELLKLGIEISQATVGKDRARRLGPPSPTWRSFLRNHADGIAALDMFVVPSATFRLLFVMLILAHDRRKIVRFDVTQNPTAGWLSRQVTEAFPWETAPRFLLRDRDASYGSIFTKPVEAMGITEVVTAPCSPWQNAYSSV